MARLDRLGPAKEVIQVGAVIGSEFSYDMLHAVHPIAAADLQRALHALADAELLYVRGLIPEATYQFKHALIRDVAYEALLKSRRKELHRQVAQTIGNRFPALGEAHPEVLARHFTEAGETEAAIAQWTKAAETAQARSAFIEALESYRQALVLLITLPESSERDLRELGLRQSAVEMLKVTRGYSGPETIEANQRVAALAEKSGSLAQLIRDVGSRWVATLVSGDLPAAGALADQLLDLGLREGSRFSLALVHMAQIMTLHGRGNLAGVEQHFAAGLEFFDDPGFRQYPGAAAVSTFGYASLTAWIAGRVDVARERNAQMMAAVNGNNLYDVAMSRLFAALLHANLKEYQQAEALAGQALELSEQHQFPFIAACSQCTLGHARAQLGHAAEGLALAQRGNAGLLELGMRGVNYAALVAATQERMNAIAEALATVEGGLQAHPDAIDVPDLLRLRGELRLKQGQTNLAEADFLQAVALAHRMGAKAWEPRTTISHARLLAGQGRREDARAMLAEIYGCFTEGFDTADLKDAKALLVELGA